MRRLTGAAAAFVVVVAVSLALAPGTIAPAGAVASSPAQRSVEPEPSDPPYSRSPGVIGSGTTRPPALSDVTEEDAAALQAAIDRARATFGLATLTVGLSVDGELGWSGVAGTAGAAGGPLRGVYPFAVASVTKTFTAAIVLQLVEEGRIRLGSPITDYLPDVTVADGATVAQVMQHVSGVPDLLAPMRTAMNANPDRIWSAPEVLAAVGPSHFVPGTGFEYSNTNYVILGMLIERVTGHRYVDELRDRIIGPLGLSATSFALEPGAPYLFNASWASAFWTSASVYASAEDLVRWADALYGGFVLRPQILDRMLDFTPDGWGLGAERLHVGELTGYGHSGLLRGYSTLMLRLPEQRVTLVVMGTTRQFDVPELLTRSAGGPSILDLALEIAAR